MQRFNKPQFERILYLMANPDIRCRKYQEKFEVSSNTFYRDKRYIKDRLWNYTVIEKGVNENDKN